MSFTGLRRIKRVYTTQQFTTDTAGGRVAADLQPIQHICHLPTEFTGTGPSLYSVQFSTQSLFNLQKTNKKLLSLVHLRLVLFCCKFRRFYKLPRAYLQILCSFTNNVRYPFEIFCVIMQINNVKVINILSFIIL